MRATATPAAPLAPPPRSAPRARVAAVGAAAAALALWYAALAALPGPGAPAHAPGMHAAGVTLQLAMSLFEAAVLVRIARAMGGHLAFGRTLAALLVLSLLHALTLALQAAAWQAPASRAWLAPLAGWGVHLPPGSARDGLSLAFGHAGLLTLARLAGTAAWLSAGGCPRRCAWAAVLACYLAPRSLTWWCADLLRGASPLG